MIVFLDISGPLLTENSAARSAVEGHRLPRFDEDASRRIAECLMKKSHVVVSSNFALQGRGLIQNWLEFNGLDLKYHPDWTSSTTMGARRDLDILGWLSRHPEEQEFVIIDDIKMPAGILSQRQVHVVELDGFSEQNKRELVKLLGLI